MGMKRRTPKEVLYLYAIHSTHKIKKHNYFVVGGDWDFAETSKDGKSDQN